MTFQMNYILGVNLANFSSMVGFGTKYAQQPHHRGSSNPSIHVQPQFTSCGQTFSLYFNTAKPNPNVHIGAIVGGPDNVSLGTRVESGND